jgi:hypothetical protein
MILAEIMTLEGALLAGVSGLVCAVVFLFGRIERQTTNWQNEIRECKKDLRECQDDRRGLSERMIRFEMSSCTAANCNMRKKDPA